MNKYRKSIALCLFLLLFFAKDQVGQSDSSSKWYLSIGTDIRQCFRTYTKPAVFPYNQNLEKPSPFYLGSLGIFIGRMITKNVSIESGLFYEVKRFQTDYDTTSYPGYKVANRFDYRYLTIPLYVNYKFKAAPWLEFSPSLGLTLDFDFGSENLWKVGTATEYSDEAGIGDGHGFSAIARVKCSIKDDLTSFSIVPFFEYRYTDLYSYYTYNTMHLYVYGASMLVTFHFR